MNEMITQEGNSLVEEAVHRILNGDQQAFVMIVETYQQQIFMYCWRLLNDRQEAEDAVQEIMVKAYEKLDKYQHNTSFSSWLYRIAYNHCLNVLRRARFFNNLIPSLWEEGERSCSAEEEVEKHLYSESLERALLKLSPTDRNLLVLRVFEEKSFQEIALVMDKSFESIRKRYSRTLQKIKKRVIELEGEERCQFTEMMWKRS